MARPACRALPAALIGMVIALCGAAHANGLDDGRALFMGTSPLAGRIAMHQGHLPSELLRCANCHESPDSPPVTRTVAPRLDPGWLLQARARRGGPASLYDLGSFCALLRTGEDPAHLVVNVQMPRYELTDQDCDQLWRYLTGPQHG